MFKTYFFFKLAIIGINALFEYKILYGNCKSSSPIFDASNFDVYPSCFILRNAVELQTFSFSGISLLVIRGLLVTKLLIKSL